MSVLTRPNDLITRTHGLIGTPYIEWAFALAGGGFGSYRELGIIENAELAQAVNNADMRDPRSGSSVLVRRHTNEFDLTLMAQTKKFDAANLQLMLLAAGITAVTAGTNSIVDEVVFLTNDEDDFVDLANALAIEATMGVTPAPITLERVGTGQGTTFGPTQGDFALDFGPLVIGDITSWIETPPGGAPVERVADLVAGGAPITTEIGVIVGASATSGEVTYFTAEGPLAGTTIDVTYEPTHTITDNVDVFYDPKMGRVRCLFSTNKLRALQPIEVTYDFTQLDHSEISPGTQLTFPGRARLRHLPDAGINMTWPIPQASIQASGDAFAFSADQWATHTIPITLEHNGSASPYGVANIYDETLQEA